MKISLLALLLCLPLAGCTTTQIVHIPEAPASRTIALMPFHSPGKELLGQQAANWTAQKLIENGYLVIDSSYTTTAVSAKRFYELGLNDEVRSALLARNLTTVVFGSVNVFTCEPVRLENFFGVISEKNRCTVSVTAKMIDTATGKLLWELMLSDSAEGKGLTAFDLVKPMITTNLSATLPLPLPTVTITTGKPNSPAAEPPVPVK